MTLSCRAERCKSAGQSRVMVTLLIFLLSLAPAIAHFDTADTSFEVQKLAHGALRFIARENGITIFDHLETQNNSEVASQSCYLQRTEAGTLWNYQGADLSYLTFLVNPQGDIILSSEAQQTNYVARKSWGFKTSGIFVNQQQAGFAILSSQASQFHNFGILKCLTADFHHDYYFNGGILHFGDAMPSFTKEAYASHAIKQTATPAYQSHLIDDYGVIIAEAGLTISGLTYRIHRTGDVQALRLDKASLEVQGTFYVRESVSGTARRIAVQQGLLHVGSLGQDLHITDWSNTGRVYCQAPSTINVQGLFDNQEDLVGHSHLTVHVRHKPQALGTIISQGELQTFIDEILTEAKHREVFDKARLICKNKTLTIDLLIYQDHFLNIRYFKIDRYGRRIFSHETGDVFQQQTVEKTRKTLNWSELSPDLQTLPTRYAERGAFVQTARETLKNRLRQLGLSSSQRVGILSLLLKGLREAGLGAGDIQAILDDEEVNAALTGIAAYEGITDEDKQKLTTGHRDSNRYIAEVLERARQSHLTGIEWVRNDIPRALQLFHKITDCAIDVFATLATFGRPAAMVSGVARINPKAVAALAKYNTQKTLASATKQTSANLGQTQSLNYKGLEGTLRGDAPKNIASHERYKTELRRDMAKPHVENQRLGELLEDLHRATGKVGSGSTAAAVRHERQTGEFVGGKSHIQKANDGIKALRFWLDKNPGARPGDRAAAENTLQDLLESLGKL